MRARSNSSRRPHRTHQPAWVAPGFCLLTLTLPLCASGWAQTTTRLSSSTSEVQGNQTSGGAYIPPFDDPDPYGTCVSGDARYVAFASLASNLVPGDTNSRWDVFVRDRQTRSTIRASVGAGGIQANGDSEFPSISADGRYVTFVSTASNLVPGDTNVRADIFVRDLQAGTTDRVSVSSTGAQANDGSFLPTISATGRYVVFQSGASNLVPGDTNLVGDAFVRDLQSGTTTRVSVDSNGVQGNDSSGDFMGAISADGRFVAFSSFASNLVPGDTNAAEDTFVHDMQTGATTRVSVDSAGGQGDSYSFYAVTMSADGRYVAFTSFADNLVGGDTNATSDVFVHDRQTGTTTLVSWDSSGNPSDNESRYPAISADGRYLAFTSKADDLVLGDTNGLYDVFVQNLQTGARTLVSVDSAATQANWNSYCEPGAISSDGRFTIFDSSAANLVSGDTNGVYDVFLHDLQTGVTTRESLGSFSVPGNSASFGPSISDNGRYAAFASAATNLVPSDINSAADVFVRDLATDNVTLVSVASNGAQGNSNSSAPQVSSNGRFVAFFSQASNLVPGDSNGFGDIFVRDIQAGSTELVTLDSSGAQGHYPMTDSPSISSDCRYVLFTALWPFVTGDTNDAYDVFVRDRLNGTTVRASVASAGAQGDGNSWGGSLSSDGRYAAFESDATNLVPNDTNGVADIFIHDMQTGATTRATLGWAGPQSNGHSYAPSLSPDGRYVAFESLASNLVPGDTNGVSDVFVCDLVTGVITRESVDSNGVQGNGPSYQAAVSRDGRFALFTSDATNLVSGDGNGVSDVFLRDRLTRQTTRLSVSSTGGEADLASTPYAHAAIAADGRRVVFDSLATNLVPDDTNGVFDVFLRDRGDAAVFAPFCFGDGSGSACPCGNSGSSGHGCQNSAGTGGAILSGSGAASLSADTAHLTSSGELPTSTSILLQGPTAISPVIYGDGLRCTGGSLKRLYVHSAVAGSVTVPQGADPSISARSAALGAPIPVGAARFYQMYYRDPSATFCPSPPGNTFNMSNAIAIQWVP